MNVRLTLVTTSVAVLAVAAFATAQVLTPSVAAAPVIASSAPVAPQVARTPRPTANVTPVIVSADMIAPVARIAPIAALASIDPSAASEAPQAATTPQPAPKVVKPATGASPKVMFDAAGEDPQAPPAPPAPPAVPQAPAVPGGVRGGRATQEVMPSLAPRRVVRGQLVNLRLEFTITDQVGNAAPVKKTVTMNVADGESGRIRTNAEVYRKAGNSGSFTSVPLMIDGTPEVEGTKIRLKASLEYQLLDDAAVADAPGGKTSIMQMVTSILNDGVQTILSQSADPLTDRKVTLEVKATIVK